MYDIKINEQIAFLRKNKGITQEELARALGVSNQAVSKWESAQSCPDIQLLPELAQYFGVSIDELMGYKGVDTSKDILLQLRNMIQELPQPEDFHFTLKMAYALHAIILSKEMTDVGNPGWDTNDAIEHASAGEWGLSCISLPHITSYMRKESAFFSSNQNLRLTNSHIRYICSLLETFSSPNNMKALIVIYQLTIHSEEAFASISQIAEECGLSKETIVTCLQNDLVTYLQEKKHGSETLYRIEGMYLHIVPLLAMFSNNG